jgi:hypothetical protein
LPGVIVHDKAVLLDRPRRREAAGGTTTRELMAILGHDDIAHAELYSREAEQRRLASEGMRKLTKLGEPRG